MKASTRRAISLCNAGYVTPAEQVKVARSIRAEWQEFLDRSDFEFAQDALSKETVSLEEAGLEEEGFSDTVPAAQAMYYAEEA